MRRNKYINWKSVRGKARLDTIVTNWFDKFEKTMRLNDYAKKEGIPASTLRLFCRREPLEGKKLGATRRRFGTRRNKYINWKSARGKARLDTIVTNWFDKFENMMTLSAKKEGIPASTLRLFCRREPFKLKYTSDVNDKRLNPEEETEAERGNDNNKGEDTKTGKNKYKNWKRKNKYKNWKRKNKYKNWTSVTGKAQLNTIVTNWFDKFEKKMTLKDYAKKQGIDVSTLGPFCRRDPLK